MSPATRLIYFAVSGHACKWTKLTLAAALISTNLGLAAQPPGGGETHGTVNILFANGNGLALVTDSRLSNKDGRAVGEGAKLFILDDHTVCAIAGFYTDPGPTINGSNPAYTSAPGILKKLKLQYETDAEKPVRFRMQELANVYAFTLARLANLSPEASWLRPPSPAELTIAGYEGDELHVSQARLTPIWHNGVWEFDQTDTRDQVVSADLVERFAGFTDVAKTIMANHSSNEVRSDPILLYFTSEIGRNKGKDLTVDDLRQAAVQLEARTSRAHAGVVGGKIQWVTLARGHITGQEVLIPDPSIERTGAVGGLQISNLVISTRPGSNMNIVGSSAPGDILSSIFVNVLLANGRQPLDGKAFLRSTFVNCTLHYDGTGPTLFDIHNSVSDSTLEVGHGVKEDDNLLVTVRKNFPMMKIVRMP